MSRKQHPNRTSEEMPAQRLNNSISDEITQVSLDDLHPDKNQARKFFDDQKLKELATSIKLQGVCEPILFREENGQFIIVAGERRYKAAILAGLETIPCRRVQGDYQIISLIENITREDLLPMEESLAIKTLLEARGKDMNQTELGKWIGKSQNTISEMLSLTKLPIEIQQAALRDPYWSRNKLLKLAKIRDPEEQKNEFIKMKGRHNTSKDKGVESKSDEKPIREVSRPFRAGISSAHKLAERLGSLSLEKATPQDKEALRSELEDLKAVIEEKMKQLQ